MQVTSNLHLSNVIFKLLIFYTSSTITRRLGIARMNSVSALGLQFILNYVYNHAAPQMSFFETIDEQRAIVLAQIAEVRIWKNFSLTWTHPNPLCSLLQFNLDPS